MHDKETGKKHYKIFDFNRYYGNHWLLGLNLCHDEDETYLMIYLIKFYISIGKMRNWDKED